MGIIRKRRTSKEGGGCGCGWYSALFNVGFFCEGFPPRSVYL